MLRADGKLDAKAVPRIIDEHKLDVTFNGKVQGDVRYGEGSTGSRAMGEGRGVGEGEARLLASQRGRNLQGIPRAIRVAGREDKLEFGANAPLPHGRVDHRGFAVDDGLIDGALELLAQVGGALLRNGRSEGLPARPVLAD